MRHLIELNQADLDMHNIEDKINDAKEGDFEDYAFNHIFGKKLRIVIPLGKKDSIPLSEKQVRIALEKEGYNVDFDTGRASRISHTNKGPKGTFIKLGKVLQRLAKKDTFWQQVSHWWEMKADKTKSMGDATGVSIIISRSPIDIMRMSDHQEWSSCHAPPGKRGHLGQYWACVGQEARSGGAIAYVVKNHDLHNLDDLQASEIFKDKNRNIQGIEPLERLRLRRFTVYNYKNHDELDILIPEETTYGIRHVGFEDSVKAWAKKAQQKIIDFKNPPKWDTADLRGGSYQDTSASSLWEDFFDVSVQGNKESIDKDEEEEYGGISSDSIYERAEEQLAAREFKHIVVSFDVEDYDEPYLWWSGSVSFDFHKDDFIQIPTEDDMAISWGTKRKKNLGEKIRNEIDIVYEEIGVQTYAGTVSIYFDLNTEEDYGETQNDRFERWLDWIDRDIEQEYNSYWAKLRYILIESGYLKDKWEWKNLKHFGLEKDGTWKNNLWIESEEMWIGDLKGVDSKNVTTQSGQLEFPNHSALSSNIATIFPSFKFLKPENIKLSTDRMSLEQGIINMPFKVILKLNIPFQPTQNKMYFAAMKHIDDNWNAYYKRAVKWWETVKPMLAGQGGSFVNTKHLPVIPKKQKIEPERQLELPFKDWFILSELPVV